MNLRSDKQVKIQALLFDLSNDPWIEHNITLFFPKKYLSSQRFWVSPLPLYKVLLLY